MPTHVALLYCRPMLVHAHLVSVAELCPPALLAPAGPVHPRVLHTAQGELG
jgi:hypothetical protein